MGRIGMRGSLGREPWPGGAERSLGDCFESPSSAYHDLYNRCYIGLSSSIL